MQRLRTTVLAVVGAGADAVAHELDAGSNVRRVPGSGDVVAAWAEVRRSARTYTVLTDDPLGAVAAAWEALYDGTGAVGELEVAVARVVGQVRAGTVDLPDAYLVTDDRRFHLSALSPQAPSRVVPVGDDAVAAVRGWRAGRWWPSIEVLLDAVERRLPDRLVTPEDGPGPGRLLGVAGSTADRPAGQGAR